MKLCKNLAILVFASALVFLNFGIAFAQTSETFDIISFKTPKGWEKKPAESAVQFTKEDKARGTYCLMTLYKSVPGTPDAKENFGLAWTSLVKEMVTVADAPKMEPAATEEGWEIHSGYAAFESDGNKGVVILVTSSGFDKMVNLMILTNTDAYEKEVSTFLESISLKQITPATKTTTNPAKPTKQIVVAGKDGFTFTTSNFDDGWNTVEQADWVQVTKNGTAVLLHYGIQYTDETRNFDDNKRIEHYWNLLISPRYKVSNINVEKPITGNTTEFILEKQTGRKFRPAIKLLSL